jgi:peptidoglycan/LPS O-acetylase OafA/YrhL
MDMLRGFAVLAIVVHHWLLFDPFQGSILVFSSLAGIIRDVAGTMVHLFFILSGCGLTLSYFKRRQCLSDVFAEFLCTRLVF